MSNDKPIGEMDDSEFEEIGFIFDDENPRYILYLDNDREDYYVHYVTVEFVDKVWVYGYGDTTKVEGVFFHKIDTKMQLMELIELLQGKSIANKDKETNEMYISGLKEMGFIESTYMAYKRYYFIKGSNEKPVNFSPYYLDVDKNGAIWLNGYATDILDEAMLFLNNITHKSQLMKLISLIKGVDDENR